MGHLQILVGVAQVSIGQKNVNDKLQVGLPPNGLAKKNNGYKEKVRAQTSPCVCVFLGVLKDKPLHYRNQLTENNGLSLEQVWH